MSIFKAYDIRGIAGSELSADMAWRIGFYLPGILKTDSILVGRDMRLSSEELAEALIRGITDAGADVIDAGLTTTPMVYYATGRLGLSGSVQVTASHNPAEYNGMKVSGAFALPVGYEDGLAELAARVRKAPAPGASKGKVSTLNVTEEYTAFLHQRLPGFNTPPSLVIDTSNGMAGMIVRHLFGDRPAYLNELPDGRFPAHEPNPLDPASRQQLVSHVLQRNAALGMIFDGDGDRVMFVDEKGTFISPDLLIALLGHLMLEGTRGQAVLQDIRSSRSVAAYLARWDARVVTWKVGRAFAARRLRDLQGVYGGELAGHYYFQDFFYSDSGMLAAMRICEVFSRFSDQGMKASEVISNISSYHGSGEINFRLQEKEAAMQAVVRELPGREEPMSLMDFDGYRLDFKDWWFNIRKSNTEPYLRFIAEARDPARLEEIIAKARKIIRNFEA